MSRAKYPMTLVTEIRRMHDAGWRPFEIEQILRARGQNPMPCRTSIRYWADDGYAEGQRENSHRKAALRKHSFKMHGRTPAYQDAFARTLRADGVSRRDIALVCRRVFADDTWDLNRVRCALGEHTTAHRNGTAVAA